MITRFLRLVGIHVRLSTLNEMQYRANFFIQLMNSALELVMGLGGLALVFYHTETLGGWGPNELIAVVGVYMLMNGWLGAVVQPAMRFLMEGIHEGTLDYVIVKPADTQFLVSVAQVQLWRLVDVVIGVAVLVMAIVRLGGQIGAAQAVIFGLTLLCGAIVLYNLWLIVSTTAFWFVRMWAVMGALQSMFQTGRWPVTIYPGWLRLSLTFLVPVAFAVTVPAEALVGRLDTSTLLTLVTLALTSLVVARLFWRVGLRSYQGASA